MINMFDIVVQWLPFLKVDILLEYVPNNFQFE